MSVNFDKRIPETARLDYIEHRKIGTLDSNNCEKQTCLGGSSAEICFLPRTAKIQF